MDPEKLKAAIDALKNGDGEAALTILEAMVVDAAAGDTPATPTPGATDAGATTTTETPAEPKDPNAPAAVAQLPEWMLTAAGTRDPQEAQARLKSVMSRGIAAEREAGAVELAERRTLIGELVGMGIETPSTAWQGEPEKRMPSRRLAGQPLAELRTYVAEMKKTRGLASTEVHPPEGESGPTTSSEDVAAEVKKLSPQMLDRIKAKGMSPEAFIRERNKATRSNVIKK